MSRHMSEFGVETTLALLSTDNTAMRFILTPGRRSDLLAYHRVRRTGHVTVPVTLAFQSKKLAKK